MIKVKPHEARHVPIFVEFLNPIKKNTRPNTIMYKFN